jgi:flavodoxin-like protein
MRSLVVYESWFGNTRRIAEEVAGGLAAEGDVDVFSVDDPVPALEDVDLLVLGGPTHVHGLSSRRSREGALTQGARGEPGIGARGFVERLPNGARGPRVAAFDTRAHKPVLLVGSAARGIARRLREHGYTLAADPESFYVEGTPGPLEEGELERAKEWGRTLANEVMSPTA